MANRDKVPTVHNPKSRLKQAAKTYNKVMDKGAKKVARMAGGAVKHTTVVGRALDAAVTSSQAGYATGRAVRSGVDKASSTVANRRAKSLVQNAAKVSQQRAAMSGRVIRDKK